MRRRLAYAVLAGLFVLVGVSGLTSSKGQALSTMNLVRRFDALADQLPEQQLLTSQGEMISWAIEILPYMTYEGLTPATSIPEDLKLFWEKDSRIFHVAGKAHCRTFEGRHISGPIYINARYTNPPSAWYGNESSLSTLVHELIHIQGGPFCTGLSEDLEANTQIATAEVMAAMVNHGNLAVLRPLLLELRSFGLAALQYELPRADYVAFLDSISDDPFELARSDKSFRYWSTQGGTQALREILYKYNVIPWESLLEGVGDGTVERIQVLESRPPYLAPKYNPMLLDDLAYFFNHAEELVAAYLQHGAA